MEKPSAPWKDALNVHRAERRGFLVLLAGCFVVAGWVTWVQWLRPADPVTLSTVTEAIGPWEVAKDLRDSARADRPERAIRLFPFDPNGLPVEQWAALGLSERQAGAIHAYEKAGGSFRSKRDLARMRVVDPELFAQWEAYIQLPDSAPSRAHRTFTAGDRGPGEEGWPRRPEGDLRRAVELNAADSAALVGVPGIGPSFAKGLIAYRNKLGGYHSLDQLSEVYVLRDKPDAVARIRERLVLDTLLVRRIPVNTASVEELAAHPYAGWKLAKALVAYRSQHGPFRDVAAIKGCVLVNDSVFRKLAPYLTAP